MIRLTGVLSDRNNEEARKSTMRREKRENFSLKSKIFSKNDPNRKTTVLTLCCRQTNALFTVLQTLDIQPREQMNCFSSLFQSWDRKD